LPHGAGDDRGHDLIDGSRLRRGAFPAGEQQVPGPDQRGREHLDVGVGRDSAQFPFGGEVGGDHGRGFREDRDAGRPGLAQPGAQVIAEDEQADDLQGDRPEQGRQRAGEVAGHGAGPGGLAQRDGLGADPAGAVEHELGQEGVKVGEVPVQDALGDPCFRGDRAAGQRVGPVPEQDALGGVEQPGARVADGYPGRHRASFLRSRDPARLTSGRVPTLPTPATSLIRTDLACRVCPLTAGTPRRRV